MDISEFNKQYTKIDYTNLEKYQDVLSFDIFKYNDKEKIYVLLAKTGTPVSKLLLHNGQFYIKPEDVKTYISIVFKDVNKYKREFNDALVDTTMSIEEKLDRIYPYMDLVVEKALHSPSDEDAVSQVKDILQKLYPFIKENLSIMDNIRSKVDSSFYIVRRSVNVSIITMCLLYLLSRKESAIKDEMIIDITLGAILKDMGMLQIPDAIIFSNQKLTDDEFAIVKEHPKKGFEKLRKECDILNKTSLEVILQHHERIDGSGYPSGKKGTDICFGARVVMIADIFNALTSGRNSRAPLMPNEAAKRMRTTLGNELDMNILTFFIVLCGPKDQIPAYLQKISLPVHIS
jgi:response regulator RpfG family c-di-GMP phosphodiesterase